jgi:hypothetical protein
MTVLGQCKTSFWFFVGWLTEVIGRDSATLDTALRQDKELLLTNQQETIIMSASK